MTKDLKYNYNKYGGHSNINISGIMNTYTTISHFKYTLGLIKPYHIQCS